MLRRLWANIARALGLPTYVKTYCVTCERQTRFVLWYRRGWTVEYECLSCGESGDIPG